MSAARAAASGGLRLVLMGATGALGREVLTVLEQAALPIAQLIPVATEHSIGVELEFRDRDLSVEMELPSLVDVDLVILCTPAKTALEGIRASLHAHTVRSFESVRTYLSTRFRPWTSLRACCSACSGW